MSAARDLESTFTVGERRILADAFRFASICGESGAESKEILVNTIERVGIEWTPEKAAVFLALMTELVDALRGDPA